MEPQYEEQFTAFVDFLGFSEASRSTDDATRLKVLSLLLSLSKLRGEFDLQSIAQENGKTHLIKPAVSTFSDHIVISYPVQPIRTEIEPQEHVAAFLIMTQFSQLLVRIAAAALRIGFLIRGGATIGKLFHGRGVVFGEALVEAFEIESRTSIYPRVVLSPRLTGRSDWIQNQIDITKCNDGLYHFDYFKMLILGAAIPGPTFGPSTKAWFDDVNLIVARNLTELESNGRLNELAKWAWFAREFRSGLERLNPNILKSFGVSTDAISWPKF
jgi:hypothetical protein